MGVWETWWFWWLLERWSWRGGRWMGWWQSWIQWSSRWLPAQKYIEGRGIKLKVLRNFWKRHFFRVWRKLMNLVYIKLRLSCLQLASFYFFHNFFKSFILNALKNEFGIIPSIWNFLPSVTKMKILFCQKKCFYYLNIQYFFLLLFCCWTLCIFNGKWNFQDFFSYQNCLIIVSSAHTRKWRKKSESALFGPDTAWSPK